MDFATYFSSALDYAEFLARHASPEDLGKWEECFNRARLTDDQEKVVNGFQRRMHVLCIAGAWCPDCSAQCPILQRIAEGSPEIDLRFIDRDVYSSTGGQLTLCGGHRVPTVIFLSEDDYFCGVYGDRSLTRYRQMAGNLPRETQGMTTRQMICQEWLNEFERIQLMLVTSPRLQSLSGR